MMVKMSEIDSRAVATRARRVKKGRRSSGEDFVPGVRFTLTTAIKASHLGCLHSGEEIAESRRHGSWGCHGQAGEKRARRYER